MEVFVLTTVWQCDSGDCGQDIRVFNNLEDAQKVLKQKMEEAREDFSYLDTEEDEFKDGDMSWSIWESQEYCYNHIDLVIYQREVE